jgi:multiple sugar transport system substrate-binding protein
LTFQKQHSTLFQHGAPGSSKNSGLLKEVMSKQFLGIGIFAAVVILYVLALYFFAHRELKPVVEIFFADRMTEAHQVLIERYNARHGGSVKVVPIDFPNQDFSTDTRKEVLARSLRGEDDAIDLLSVDVIGVHRFAKWCEPLGKYFTEEERNRITETGLHTCYYDGELMAAPLDVVQGVMFYREDLLLQLPGGQQLVNRVKKGIPWQDLLKAAERIQYPGPVYIFPAADYEGLICSYIEILLSLRPRYFETIGFRFNTPEAKKALQLLVDLVQKYKVTPPVVGNFTEVSSFEYFIRQNGLFIRGWTSYDKDFKNAQIDSIKESRLQKAQIPYLAEGKPSAVFGGWNLMVAKSSKKKEAVIDFIKFLLTEESQETFYSQAGYYPVIKSFYTDSVFLHRYPEITQVKELMRFGVHRPVQENYTKYSKIMARYFHLAILGRISVEEAMDRVQNSIESEGNQLGVR